MMNLPFPRDPSYKAHGTFLNFWMLESLGYGLMRMLQGPNSVDDVGAIVCRMHLEIEPYVSSPKS